MTMRAAREPLPTAYDPSQVEGRLYEWWERSGFFRAAIDPDKEPFTVIMPPPNVTGELHIGHAQRAAIEDALVRFHRMRGRSALYLPGTDHAGIATQVVVERQLAAEGELTRHDMGRAAFLQRVWDWVGRTGDTIDNQHRRLGASCDWERKAFTLDPGPARAVRTTFKSLYDDGLIYRGERMINWCVSCRTALSDLEVEHEEEQGSLSYIRYPYEDGNGHLTVATTRPETLLGDTAVAVNPSDPRYAGAVGKRVLLPVLGRPIPVIADEAVATEFGTGALKITPGHDPNDFETGERHGLPIVNILNSDGTLNEEAGPYAGFDRYEARKAIVAQLEGEGLLEKVEPHTHSVGHCQRSGDAVEPIVSMQWFVKIGPLAEPALAAVRDGRVRIVPERFVRVYENWMENIRDWCISRQLWWGHRIPVWYCACGHATVAVDDPAACEACGGAELAQDEDVLDTWFSSALWPHSTLGWPEETDDLAYFYPTSVLETGYDILFFWVARMMMMGMRNAGDVPFRTVYLSGLVRDEHGQKMSKTRGNVRDPLEVIAQYGTDALRFALTTGSTPGSDIRFSDERLESARNFANKLWNVGRFVVRELEGRDGLDGWNGSPPREHREDRWILSKAQQLAVRVNDLVEEYQLGEAERVLQEFIWSDFADWYIELAKVRLRAGDERPRQVLGHVLERVLRLLHPFMPFVTEELWQRLTAILPDEAGLPESIMVAPYPHPRARLSDAELSARREAEAPAVAEIELLIDLVRAVRNARAEFRVGPRDLLNARIDAPNFAEVLREEADAVRALAGVGDLRFGDGESGGGVRLVVQDATVTLDVGGAVDLGAERARLAEEAAETEKRAAQLRGRLGNEQFTSKAPAEVVERERERLAESEQRLVRIRELLENLGA